MRHKIALYQRHVGIRIQLLVVGQLEKPSVRIEGGLEQFGEELPEKPATVDACLIQTGKVRHLDPHLEAHVRFCRDKITITICA